MMTTDYDDDFIGEPEFGGNTKKKFKNANWKVMPGDNVYRILPPCHSLAKSGRWSYYEAIHWGFAGTNGKLRPFRCMQRKNSKTKMVEQECPVCNWVEGKRQDYDNLVNQLKKDNRSKEDIERLTKDQFQWLMRFNIQKGHYVNAMRQDGEIGRLFLKIKCKQNLDALNAKLSSKERNAISASKGLWLVFTKQGLGRETTYPVSVYQEECVIEGTVFNKDKEAPLTPDIIARMKTEAFDLPNVYTDITYEQAQMLVGSKADPKVVDSIFGLPTVSAMPEPEVDDPPVELPETAPTPQSEPVKVAPPSAEEDAEARLEAQLMALRAKKAQKSPPKAEPTLPKSEKTDAEVMELVKAFQLGKM